MGTRSLTQRLARVNEGRDPGGNLLDVQVNGAAYRVAAGTGTMVTGSVVVATGLATVTAFTCSLKGSGNTSASVTGTESVRVTAITTGAVTVAGLWHSATASVSVADVTGTNDFYWIAIGT